MTWVFRVGNQTLRITASNAAEALRRARIVFPGQTIGEVREGGRSGDANFRLINPSYIDEQNNPVYTAESTTGDPTGALAEEFRSDTSTTADPARDTGGMGGNGGNGSGGFGFDVDGNRGGQQLSFDAPGAPLSAGNRFASFLRDLTETGMGQGLASNLLQRRYSPVSTAFDIEGILSGARGQAPTTFEDFLGTTQPGYTGAGGRLRQGFGELADLARRSITEGPIRPGELTAGGLTEEEQRIGRLYARPTFDPNDREEQNAINMLITAARESALSRFSPRVGNQMFGRSQFDPGSLQAKFQSQIGTSPAGVAPAGDFTNFLRQQFALPTGATF